MTTANGRVAGRVAIVTGAASGIGRASAMLLAEEGAAVLVVDVNGDGSRTVAEEMIAAGGAARAFEADTSTVEGTEAMAVEAVDTFGGIDILHNNAGIAGVYQPAHLYPVQMWDEVIATNLRSVFLGSRAVIPHMLEAGKGSIVNTCSTFGSFVARDLPAYSAAKGGVLMLTKQMAVDYGPAIRVNAVSPGTIESGMMRAVIAAAPDPQSREREFIQSNPVLQRIGDPREIAYGVLFLASDESSFMVGSNLFMGGGQGLFASPIS